MTPQPAESNTLPSTEARVGHGTGSRLEMIVSNRSALPALRPMRTPVDPIRNCFLDTLHRVCKRVSQIMEMGRTLTAMVTPFDDHGKVDLAGASRLAQWLVEQGNDGLVITGTTGEGNTLTDEEQVAVWKAVRSSVSVPLIAGCGTNDTEHTIQLTSRAESSGMDCALVVTPYYNRPSQSGIEAHFQAICRSTKIPVMIYDIPVRTGRKIDTETMVRLASELPNIVGVKDAANDPAESARLLSHVRKDFLLYSGVDALTLPLLSIGGTGVIGVCTHWATPEMRALIESYRRGDVEEATAINRRLIDSYRFESSELTPNPLPVKAMLRSLGLPAGQCRLPMGPAPASLEAEAAAVFERLRAAR